MRPTRKELGLQLGAALRENAELVKDKETLTCALEYARADLESARVEVAAIRKLIDGVIRVVISPPSR